MDKFYTREEVAKILRVHPRTILLWVHTGKLQATRVGRKWLIAKESVIKALENQG